MKEPKSHDLKSRSNQSFKYVALVSVDTNMLHLSAFQNKNDESTPEVIFPKTALCK